MASPLLPRRVVQDGPGRSDSLQVRTRVLEAEFQGSGQIGNAKDGFVRVVKADSFVHSARSV